MNAKPQTDAINSIKWKILTPDNIILENKKKYRPKILVKFPTRGRSEQFFETLFAMYALSNDVTNLRFIITCDKDDVDTNNKHFKGKIEQFANLKMVFGNSKTKIEACNADITGDFDIIILASDDMIPVVRGWDDIIRDEMLKYYPDFDGSLWFNDGYQKRINTLSILGKAYYNRFGYIYHPSYKSFFCDDEQTEVGRLLNKIKYNSKIIFRHQHPFWTGAANDKTYLKNANYFEADKKNFEERKKINFNL